MLYLLMIELGESNSGDTFLIHVWHDLYCLAHMN